MLAETAKMPRKPKRNDLVVKVDAEVVRMARIIAAIEDTHIAAVLSDNLRPLLEKKIEDYEKRGLKRSRKS